jgi:hypothetical protein
MAKCTVTAYKDDNTNGNYF